MNQNKKSRRRTATISIKPTLRIVLENNQRLWCGEGRRLDGQQRILHVSHGVSGARMLEQHTTPFPRGQNRS
jgi:hypothetical protein